MAGSEMDIEGGKGAEALLVAVAVLGPDASFDHLRHLLAWPSDRVRAVAGALAEEGRLEGHGFLALAADHQTKDVLARQPPAALARLRIRAAQVLDEAGCPAQDAARHLLHVPAVGEGWAVDLLERAATEMVQAGDQRAATAMLGRLLEERPPTATRIAALTKLAGAEAHVEPEAAVDHLRQAVALAADGDQRAELRLRFARLLSNLHRLDDALEQVTAAAADTSDEAQHLRASVLYVSIARTSLHTRRRGLERLRRLPSEVPDPPRDPVSASLTAELAYESCLAAEPVAVVLDLVHRALGGSSLEGLLALEEASQHVAVLTLVWCGQLDEAERAAHMALARADRTGSDLLAGLARHWLLQVSWRRARYEDAVVLADRILAVAQRGLPLIVPATTGFKALALAANGDLDGAQRALQLPEGEDRWSALAHFHGYLLCAARVALMAGQPEEAYRRAVRLGTLATSMGTINPAVLPWRSVAALALAEMGQSGTGLSLAEDDLAQAHHFGAPGPIATAMRAQAANTAEPSLRLRRLRDALRWSESSPDLFEQAQCRQQIEAATGAGVAEGPGSPGRRDEIRALGQFSVVDPEGRDITPSGVPGRAVRILVAAGGRLHLEQLADRLWPETTAAVQLKRRLRNVLYRARGAGGNLIVRNGELAELSPHLSVDVFRFEQAARQALQATGDLALENGLVAVALYRGELLPSDPYADWAAFYREQLRRQFLTLVDRCSKLASDKGLLDLAADLIETGIQHDPYDVDRYLRAAAVHRQAGQTARARSLEQSAADLEVRLGTTNRRDGF